MNRHSAPETASCPPMRATSACAIASPSPLPPWARRRGLGRLAVRLAQGQAVGLAHARAAAADGKAHPHHPALFRLAHEYQRGMAARAVRQRMLEQAVQHLADAQRIVTTTQRGSAASRSS
ncbi:hypothetical protein LP420_03680 [Massilia sp. B-10]|nr:hypothetical protein LP420_03680 [Massilia sp. B-10]